MICAVLNWCSSSDNVSRITWFRFVSRNSVVDVREKFKQPVGDFRRAKALLRNLVQHRAQPRIALSCLESICAYDEITASGVLISCATPAASRPMELSLSACASCDSSDTRSVMSSTRMMRPTETKSRDSSGATAMLAVRCSPARVVSAELVKVMHALLVAETVNRIDKFRRENGAKCLAQRLGAAQRVHRLHLRIPALDAIVEVDRKNAHVDRFDNVFVEFLQALELADLVLQACVKPRILQRDSDVARKRFQQLHVFADRKSPPIVRPRPITAIVRGAAVPSWPVLAATRQGR